MNRKTKTVNKIQKSKICVFVRVYSVPEANRFGTLARIRIEGF